MTNANQLSAEIAAYLDGRSDYFLQDVVDHGIHNLANDFCDRDDYDAIADEAKRQAGEILAARDRALLSE